MKPIALIFLLLSLLTVAGCGQKGPLYLPEETPAEAAAEAAEDEENTQNDE